jgi:hypothetical protein
MENEWLKNRHIVHFAFDPHKTYIEKRIEHHFSAKLNRQSEGDFPQEN